MSIEQVDTYIAPFVATELEKFADRFQAEADHREELDQHVYVLGLQLAAVQLSRHAKELREAVAEKRRQQVETLAVLATQNERRFGSYPGNPDETELSDE